MSEMDRGRKVAVVCGGVFEKERGTSLRFESGDGEP